MGIDAGMLAGKTVAITGASGFLGARLAARLSPVDCRVIRVPRRAAWDPVVSEAEIVFHFAAQTSVEESAADPAADFDANVAPMRALLGACARAQRRPFILFAGTVTQAGVPARLPMNEDAVDEPITVYDRHKLIAETDLEAAVRGHAALGTTLRLTNVYGPGTHGGNKNRNVLNRMIAVAVDGAPLTVYGGGEYLRDYIFVEDVVDAFLAAAAHRDAVNGRHFVIGTGEGITIRKAFELVADRAAAHTGRRAPVITIEPPAPLSAIERRNFIADASRFSAATGWRPRLGLRDGIDRTIEAYVCA